MMGASAGTSNTGNLDRARFVIFTRGESPRRASSDSTFPSLRPVARDRCTAASYTSWSSVTVVLMPEIMIR